MSRLPSIREPYRMLLIGLATLVVFAASKAWPHLAYALWTIFVGGIAVLLYADLREPVNYDGVRISAGVVEYEIAGQRKLIRLEEVTKLAFVREDALFPDLDGPYLETKWVFQLDGLPMVEVMDEWPHRKQLLQAFRDHLPGFDTEAARAGLKASAAGRWVCYQA